MKKLKFVGTDPRLKQFGVEVRKRVSNYFTEKGISMKGNNQMFVKAFVMLSLYIVPIVVLLTVNVNMWAALALVIITGIGEAGVGMSVMHDAAHNVFADKRWINKLFAGTINLLGSNTYNWKVQHNLMHHTYTNIYEYDPDIETKAVIRLCDHAPLKKYHRFQHIYAFPLYGLMTLLKLGTDFNQLAAYNRAGITREQSLSPFWEMVKLVAIKIIYIGVLIGLPLWLTDFHWWQILIGFAIMQIVAGIIMSTVFQMAHVVEGTIQPVPDENGVIHTDWAVHELLATSDFARNSHFLSWYAGGLNFQIEHHLFPNVCHIHYREIAPIVEQTAHEFGLTYNLKASFLEALKSHRRRLKELGRYKYEASLFPTLDHA